MTLQPGTACEEKNPKSEGNSFMILFQDCDRNGLIKVADFGLTEDMYGNHYFRRGKSETGSDEKVQIKWMAPESIENDVYTEATDVVSTDIAAASICGLLLCSVCVVVIWSDSVGDLHLWEDPILWSPSHETTEGIAKRRETRVT